MKCQGVICAVCVCLVAAVAPVRATDLRHVEDATLHAVQFLNAQEGWAVGDEGAVWRTTDGGKTWERQPTGTRASLRSVWFHNAQEGWVVGREELPQGGSVGVLLYTSTGGESTAKSKAGWHRVLANALPGLNKIYFVDNQTGFLLGDGAEQLPSGLCRTDNGGQSWRPIRGPRASSWLDGLFQDGDTGALTGVWSQLSILRQGSLIAADVDPLGGRSVRGVRPLLERTLAVGDGGLVLASKTGGKGWGYVDLKLPAEVLSGLDFHAISTVGAHAWIAGRPGSVVLHSADQGRNWEVQKTGQPLPIHGLHFADMRRGWAVGALGTILATTDGGKTWQVQQRGGQRAAVLFVQAQGQHLPAETLARLGLEDGYLVAGVSVLGPDPKSAGPAQAAAAQRLAAAVRLAGGAAGELLWQFPLPQHLGAATPEELLNHWNELHGRRAADQMLRQLVLALRVWQPDVVVADPAEPKKVSTTGGPLVAEALRQACKLAADPQAFPEQLEVLGLKTCRVVRIFSLWHRRDQADVVDDGNELLLSLRGTPRDFATPAAALLGGDGTVLPPQRCFRLLETYLTGVGAPRQLMSDLELKADRGGRRIMPEPEEVDPKLVKALQARRQLQAFADNPVPGLTNADKLVAEMGRVLDKLPPDQGAAAAFALANNYVRTGQWMLAQEIYLTMVDRYPTHPLTAEAYRWLVRHNTSSEVRRRYELKQFVQVNVSRTNPPRVPTPDELKQLLQKQRDQQPKTSQKTSPADGQKKRPGAAKKEPGRLPLDLRDANGAPLVKGTSVTSESQITYLANQADMRLWQQGSLEFAKRLECFGPLYARDPSVQFCLQSAHRQMGKFQEAFDWYKSFETSGSPESPWRAAAAAEVWLTTRDGTPPRPVQICRRTTTRPFLDGKFDDGCWQNVKPTVLQNAVQDTTKDYHTEVRLAYDDDFLYLALTCTHPPECHVPPAKERPRDANLDGFDRVSILLDLDRDYNTYFQLQVDQRGCVCEDCWGDRSWDPRWFVAVRSTKTAWNIEAAIPLRELTGERVSLGTAWACNVVRVLPRRGVQALSLPADVQPRPEGMGLLIFQDEVDRRK